MEKHVCTCRDLDCPLHPANHTKGCDPCITKNRANGEIPSCFFRAVHDDLDGVTDYSIKGFIDFFNKYNTSK